MRHEDVVSSNFARQEVQVSSTASQNNQLTKITPMQMGVIFFVIARHEAIHSFLIFEAIL